MSKIKLMKTDDLLYPGLALGVFLGNTFSWAVLANKGYLYGLAVGTIAALLVLLLWGAKTLMNKTPAEKD